MAKIYKNKVVLSIQLDRPVLWQDFKDFKFKDGDEVEAGYEEPYYGSDSAHDGYYYFYVTRKVLETDEEFEKRVKENKIHQEQLKKRRYENYLKLKEEFENKDM